MTRLYTGKGDDGTTGLLFGGRVPKDSALPRAVGGVDEAQATIGAARALCDEGGDLDLALTQVCRDLWVLMAEVATLPQNRAKLVDGQTRVSAEMVTALEALVDDLGERFEAPSQFVVPGQTPLAAQLDVARTVVRRAERDAVPAAVEGSHVLPYLNRLSSLLWVQARWVEGEHLLARDVDAGG
ncbi:MAG TPA: cob(I)yrinic acid a,c-diamide adenosyltransferase [Acidimicrobiales bacterium]|nr:cob(I)yrinic acid a,c-diamide adenosyltransferase [Acidimicrobiales bacterium]